MIKQPDGAHDLVEIRRKITVLRSRHSDDARVTYLLNRLLIKLAYLTEPESIAHAQRLRDAFERTMAEVEKSPSAKSAQAIRVTLMEDRIATKRQSTDGLPASPRFAYRRLWRRGRRWPAASGPTHEQASRRAAVALGAE